MHYINARKDSEDVTRYYKWNENKIGWQRIGHVHYNIFLENVKWQSPYPSEILINECINWTRNSLLEGKTIFQTNYVISPKNN